MNQGTKKLKIKLSNTFMEFLKEIGYIRDYDTLEVGKVYRSVNDIVTVKIVQYNKHNIPYPYIGKVLRSKDASHLHKFYYYTDSGYIKNEFFLRTVQDLNLVSVGLPLSEKILAI
jgi:hypothetical protein